MHPLAETLNHLLKKTPAYPFLSETGKALYFPRGIVAQTTEASRLAGRFNATAGVAQKSGVSLCLPALRKHIRGLTDDEITDYAPTAGCPGLREHWSRALARKNPDLSGKSFSLPVVTAGITHAISITAELFADPGDTVVLPDLHWDNYRLVFGVRHRADIKTFPFFKGTGMNIEGLRHILADQKTKKKLLLILNFPNNPTGYSPSAREASEITMAIKAAARAGKKILVLSDDAYFGLFHEKELFMQSLFAKTSSLHRNVLAVKTDGATKEELAWGLRVGFITFGAPEMTSAHYEALEQKTMGAVRSSVSNASMLSQNLLLKTMEARSHEKEKANALILVKKRYEAAKHFTRTHKSSFLRPLPFNSGYFLTFECRGIDAESLRAYLLEKGGIGTVSFGRTYLRVTYARVDTERLGELFTEIYKGADMLGSVPSSARGTP